MTQRISQDRDEVLKIDKRGRVRSTPVQRMAALEEFDRSGLSGIKFAALAGINYQTLAAWLSKRRRIAAQQPTPVGGQAGALGPGQHVRWVEAVVDPASQAPPPLQIELPGGVRLEIRSAAQVPLTVDLLRALQLKEGRPC